MLHLGASIGYWQGDPRKLMDDIAALRPTIFAAVPRIFERVYAGVQDAVSGVCVRWTLRRAAWWLYAVV
jgi:long-chain acyl-CoA synthetase